MYKTSSEAYTRPNSVQSNVGRIPSVALQDSGVRIPDNNIIQFHNEKAREQWAITKQVELIDHTIIIIIFDCLFLIKTYRTTPIISPTPKVRRDWPTGCYLQHMEGPGWHELPKTIQITDPTKLRVLNQYTQSNSLNNTTQETNNNPTGLVHLQYNSPINLYSSENVQNSVLP